MPRRHRAQLRLIVQVAIWTLMVLALLGPHTHWSVCLSGRCGHGAMTESVAQRSVPAATPACCCCQHPAEKEEGAGGGARNGAKSCCGCCIDLAIDIDVAPVPTPVRPPPGNGVVVAILPALVPPESSATEARFEVPDTGPPRIDRRIELIPTTVLRE